MTGLSIFAGLSLAIILLYAFVIILGLAATIFWIVEFVDALRREFYDPIMKVVWLLLVFFSHVFGAILYYFIGKKQGRLPGEPNYPPRY